MLKKSPLLQKTLRRGMLQIISNAMGNLWQFFEICHQGSCTSHHASEYCARVSCVDMHAARSLFQYALFCSGSSRTGRSRSSRGSKRARSSRTARSAHSAASLRSAVQATSQRVLCALALGRAKDVGVAYIELSDCGYVHLLQISDGIAFSQTLVGDATCGVCTNV